MWGSAAATVLNALDVGEQVINLRGLEAKLGHLWMTYQDAFSECFFKRVDWVVVRERPECRRHRVWAFAFEADRMAAGAIHLRSPMALHRVRGGYLRCASHGLGAGAQEERQGEDADELQHGVELSPLALAVLILRKQSPGACRPWLPAALKLSRGRGM